MKNISVDLETMGIRPDAAITAIGAVEFDDLGNLGREFYINVDLQSCIDAGLTISGSTVMWWLRQDGQAREALMQNPAPTDVWIALAMFSKFFLECEAEFIWARGQDFDISIMRCAYDKVGSKHPWKYNHARDSRTLYAVTGFDEKSVPPIGTAHNALDDAKWEATAISAALVRQSCKVCSAFKIIDAQSPEAFQVRPAPITPDVIDHLIGEHGRVINTSDDEIFF